VVGLPTPSLTLQRGESRAQALALRTGCWD